MKKIIFTTILFFILVQPTSAVTWLNCPFGKINDPYPGLCARYTDTDQDGLCDNSQPDPANRVIKTKSQTKNPVANDYYLIEVTVILFLLYGLSKYLVYYSSQTKNKFLKPFNSSNTRYMMNMILLASFILSFITALLFLAQVKLGWFTDLKVNFSWWHIEFGWIMAVVSLIHLGERWRYFIKT